MFTPIVLCAVLVFICQVLGTHVVFFTKIVVGPQIEEEPAYTGAHVGVVVNQYNRKALIQWQTGTENQGLLPCGSLGTTTTHLLANAEGGCRARFACLEVGDAEVGRPVTCLVKKKVLSYCEHEDIKSIPACDDDYLEKNGLQPSERKADLEGNADIQSKPKTYSYYTYIANKQEPEKISLSITTTKYDDAHGGFAHVERSLRTKEVPTEDELVPCSLLLPMRVRPDRWQGNDGSSCSIELGCNGTDYSTSTTKCLRNGKRRLSYCGVLDIVNQVEPCKSWKNGVAE